MQYMTNSTPKMKQLRTTHKSARFCDTDSRTHRELGSAQRSAQRRSRRAHRVIDVAIRRPIGCSRQHSVLALRLRVRLTASAYEVRGGLRLDEHALRDELERDGNRGRSAHRHGRHGVPSCGRPPARRPRTGREPSLRDAHLRATALATQAPPAAQIGRYSRASRGCPQYFQQTRSGSSASGIWLTADWCVVGGGTAACRHSIRLNMCVAPKAHVYRNVTLWGDGNWRY